MIREFTIQAIEREYGIPYEEWPVGTETNYMDAVNMLNLKTPRVINQLFHLYYFLYDMKMAVCGLDDIISICRYIISRNYIVGSYKFDADLIGIILRRAILAEWGGLVLLPDYRGLGYGHIGCWATKAQTRDYSSREMPLRRII